MPELHFSQRGGRDLPGGSTRVRGSTSLPYNPNRPLRLPNDRRPRKRPQLNPSGFLRLFFPILILVGMGLGIFFGVDALLDNREEQNELLVTPENLEDLTVTQRTVSDATVASSGDVKLEDTESVLEDSTKEVPTPVESVADEDAVTPAIPIITSADLDGSPVFVERGAATPIPSGTIKRTLHDGSLYNPADASIAFSGTWIPGTELEITRLPGGPLLTDEEASLLIGKVIRVTVAASDEIQTELQLSPAAFELLALPIEPIIALYIKVLRVPD